MRNTRVVMMLKSLTRPWSCPRELLLCQDPGPVGVRFLHVSGDVLRPELLHVEVVIEVELSVDEGPRGWIDFDRISAAHAERAVATVLGRIRLGLLRKQV